MFGMFIIFRPLVWRCLMDPFSWPEIPEPDDTPNPALDEPKDGE